MFTVGILVGLYAFIIFFLGLLGFLYQPVVWLVTALFLVGAIVYWRKNIREISFLGKIEEVRSPKKDYVAFFLLLIIVLQALINLIGALGPELGFDANWYHLTLPKLYLINHAVIYIPGGLLFYSTMPKLLELLYTGGLAFGSNIFPKLTHFSFGILTAVVLYKMARKFISMRMALLAVVIYYTNLVVGWESISAYIDLGRTFFELLAVFAFLQWMEKEDKKWFIYSAIFMGFAITTKILALGSLVMLLVLITLVLHKKSQSFVKPILIFSATALFIPLPWIVFSFIHTGNPLYPFFSSTYPVPFLWQLFNPLYFITAFWNLFLFSPDPINPIYIMLLPLVFVYSRKWPTTLRLLLLYTLGGLFFWYITPQTGGGRFIVPYLPLMSLISVVGLLSLQEKKLKQFIFIIAIIVSLTSIGYRAIANAKFIPVLLGKETASQFLATHLNFSYGDFVDSDGYFKTHIKPTDTVLLYGFHNENYIDFPFIDATWVKKGDSFNYIAVQNGKLPQRFQIWNLVYTNPITHVALYSIGGIPWVY